MPSPSPNSRARSRSPERRKSRSRSPPRGPREKKFSGLKWKKQDRRDDDRDDRWRDDRRRDDRDRRGGYRERDEDRRRDDRFSGRRDRDERDRGYERRDRDRSDRPRADRDERRNKDLDRPAKSEESKKPKTAAPAAGSGEQMIIVTVNDRLGTKAQIPCLASDPIKVFKAMVAARIGRPAHEIMLKRQGERPMKDQLTLEDYGVSNGVQLDLELDTGD